MRTSLPYLTIPCRCEEALAFYATCFGGEVTFVQRYAETSYSVSDKFEQKIAHAEFVAPGLRFFASDGHEGANVTIGENVAITVNFDSFEDQEQVFKGLSDGGTVTNDFATTSVGSRLVTLVDRFGIHWYLNFETSEV